jgi:hypothetical protein
MSLKATTLNFRNSRRPSQLGDRLTKRKIEDAQQLTSEQRLVIALELSDTTAALQRACSKKH